MSSYRAGGAQHRYDVSTVPAVWLILSVMAATGVLFGFALLATALATS